jgi:hypothetical protein
VTVDPTQAPAGEHADQALTRIRQAMPGLLADLEQRLRAPTAQAPFPLLHFGQKHRVARVSPEQAGAPEEWFFIGDLHGDFFALHTLLQQAQALRPDCRILFLGDMVDRGSLPLECVFLLLDWGLRHPGRLAWIAGNHDIAFSCDAQGVFHSIVNPAELLFELNVDDPSGERQRIGRFFIDMAHQLPRALLFPGGLLATHGGFPLVDLHPQGQAVADEPAYLDWLNTDACLKDFTWTRIHRAPRKIPDRYSSGSQYGFTDFDAFCRLQPQWFPVSCMVTGHEHPRDGFDLHLTYQTHRALTLLGMGFDEYAPESVAKYATTLHLGQGVTGTIPAVIEVPVDVGALARFLGQPLPQAADPTPAPTPSAAPGAAPVSHPAAAPAPVAAASTLAPKE